VSQARSVISYHKEKSVFKEMKKRAECGQEDRQVDRCQLTLFYSNGLGIWIPFFCLCNNGFAGSLSLFFFCSGELNPFAGL
jgi:hypothetical protein